jgi:hypothetical protein
MKLVILCSHILLSLTIYCQSLSLGSGYFFDIYRPIGERSVYHKNVTRYFWAFLGGSASYNFGLSNKWFNDMSVFANCYPLMTGNDLRNYPENNFFHIGQEPIAPEIGIISHYSPINKKKHKLSLGTGLASRFVLYSVTGSFFSYTSPTLYYTSTELQKSRLTVNIPFELLYIYKIKPQFGLFLSIKRTFGFYRWIEQNISYEFFNQTTNNLEIGKANMVNNGNRSLMEFGFVFDLKEVE